MDCNLQVIFQNMPEKKSLRRYIEKKMEQLDQKFEGIEHCRVSIDLPHYHRYPSNIYDVQVEIDIPENMIKVARSPSADGASINVFAVIREIFNEVDRKLDACACAKEAPGVQDESSLYKRSEGSERQVHLH